MPLTPFEYLTEHAPETWEYKHVGGLIVGCCPLHNENTPSFKIYPDGHWHCYGACDTGGDNGEDGTVPLIKHLEFSNDPSPVGWAKAGDRYRQLSGLPPKWTGEKKDDKEEPRGNLLATEEQQAVMRVFEKWCHQCLWDINIGDRGRRYYEEERCVPLSEYYHNTQVAYAPSHPSWTREGKELFNILSEMMRKHVGKDWQRVALDLQILKEGRDGVYLRFIDRIMFFCHDQKNNTVFFQGRKVELPGDLPNDYPKSMNPYGIKKMPFWVPVRNRLVKGTADIEGPTGALLLPLYGIFTVAWLGGDPSYFLMRQFPGPRILLQDHDPLKQGKGGLMVRAGDEHAKAFANMCDKELHQSWVRIIPGIEGDGPDDWVNRDGRGPLFEQLKTHNLLIPTNKTPTGLYLAQVG